MQTKDLKVSSFFIALILMLSIFLTGLEFYRSTLFVYRNYSFYLWVCVGILTCIILGIIFNRNSTFLQALAHEGAHFVVGLLFFKKIKSIKVSEAGNGMVEHYGNYNMFISLAPYCAPYLTYVILLIRLIILPKYVFIVDILIGLTLGFHFSCFAHQTRSYQPDLRVFGLFKSYLFIFTFLFFNLAVILYAIKVNLWLSFATYFKQMWSDIILIISLM
jgi:hypothetical protein